MRKQFLFLVLALIVSVNSFSQVIFENGYFISENNQKTSCLIENMDWKNTPVNFRYKLDESGEIKTADIKTIKEFAVSGQFKFISSVVKIDRSSKRIEFMTKDKNPVFSTEKLFLQVLMEGKANLYLYNDGTVRRFFYKTDNSEIKQLVYKTYLADDDHTAKNNQFREQLFIDLKCDGVLMNEYEKLTYTKKDLERFFAKYNKCSDSNFVDLDVKEKKDLFNLTLRPRYNMSSLSLENSEYNVLSFDFDKKSSISLGIEAEFILPFNKDRWSVIVEPTYQSYKGEQTIQTNQVVGGTLTGKVDYKSVELPVGVRRYFFVNDAFKIFANASMIVDFSTNSSVTVTRKDGSPLNELEIKSGINFGLGLGCKFKDKVSLEVRYQTSRGLLADNPVWTSSYQTTALILGYSFF